MSTHAATFSREARRGIEGYWRVACRCGFNHGAGTKAGANQWYLNHRTSPDVVCPMPVGSSCDEHGEIAQVPADSGR